MLNKIKNWILSLFKKKEVVKKESKIEKETFMPKMLTEQDYTQASKLLQCDIPSIKAVISVETSGKGFISNTNKPTILFEGHIFYKQLKQRGKNPEDYKIGNEDIIYSKWTKQYYKQGLDEYKRLERAKKIDIVAAYSSASYGLGQIMGFNYKLCGYDSVENFVEAMCVSEGNQLIAFCNFVKNNTKMWNALKRRDWATFACAYNGPEYVKNNYDVKLKKAYQKYL